MYVTGKPIIVTWSGADKDTGVAENDNSKTGISEVLPLCNQTEFSKRSPQKRAVTGSKVKAECFMPTHVREYILILEPCQMPIIAFYDKVSW